MSNVTKIITKVDRTNNPIIGYFSAFYAVNSGLIDHGNDPAGPERAADPAITSNLRFLCTTMHRNLYLPVQLANGQMPGIKERMDNSEKRLSDLMNRVALGDEQLQTMPEMERAAYNWKVDEERFNAFHTFYVDLCDAYKHHTGEDFKFTDSNTNMTSEKKVAASAALAEFKNRLADKKAAVAGETLITGDAAAALKQASVG